MAPWIAVIADRMVKDQTDKIARQQLDGQLGQQFSGAMGVPGYGIEAAQEQEKERNAQGMGYVQDILKQYGYK